MYEARQAGRIGPSPIRINLSEVPLRGKRATNVGTGVSHRWRHLVGRKPPIPFR